MYPAGKSSRGYPPLFIALDFNEKQLWVQLFQLFATKTVIINWFSTGFQRADRPKGCLRFVFQVIF
jgi:hypothetical protein